MNNKGKEFSFSSLTTDALLLPGRNVSITDSPSPDKTNVQGTGFSSHLGLCQICKLGCRFLFLMLHAVHLLADAVAVTVGQREMQ